MKALGDHGFPVPTAVDCNRHCVIMSLVQGYPLVQVKELQNPDDVFNTILGLIVRLSEHGLIHCDFNEFNIMVFLTVILNVSTSSLTKEKNEEQDGSETEGEDEDEGEGEENGRPSFLSVEKVAGSLDKELAASGFTREEQLEMDKFIEEDAQEHSSCSDDDSTSDINEIGDDVPINSLKIEDQDHSDESDHSLGASRNSYGPGTLSEQQSTSCSGENGFKISPSANNEDAAESVESVGNMASQDGNNYESDDDSDDEDDAALTRQLNKQGRKQ